MRAAIYNPYLDTLGGGERYSIAVATVLRESGYTVGIQWKNQDIKELLNVRFGADLSNIDFVVDVKKGEGYEVCFWVSDGSIPLLRARNNILHFQVPFTKVKGKTLINKMKLFRINHVVCNSKFTKKYIDTEYGVRSKVIYPPVDIERFKPKRKENIILSVGRFSHLLQAKRQDVLVRAFKKLYDSGFGDWKLILAGGKDVGVSGYIKKLMKLSKGYPVEILKGPDFKTLRDLFGRARLFWTASGYGINEKKEPEKVEHFGITLVEAMAAKCLTLAYDAGGYREIIRDGKNGYLWKTPAELVSTTRNVISDSKIFNRLVTEAKETAQIYSYENFKTGFSKLL